MACCSSLAECTWKSTMVSTIRSLVYVTSFEIDRFCCSVMQATTSVRR